ncbi:hypothetical protein [Vibrio parahaemolyticus]|nr:hypothetical protein [Vibrio parahaemolyticus]
MKIERVKRNPNNKRWRIGVSNGRCIHYVNVNKKCNYCILGIPF